MSTACEQAFKPSRRLLKWTSIVNSIRYTICLGDSGSPAHMAAKLTWSGVYPAATTQFTSELPLDLPATQKVQGALIDDGVDGLIIAGTVGENNSLEPDEKRAALEAGVEVAAGRVPIIVGVSELTTTRAIAFARDAERIGADALMVLPAMVYVPTDEELYTHFKA